MTARNHIPNPFTRCRGFSLVELMVALVITLILLAGIGQIFLSSKKSFNIQNSLARIQENGRYALEVLKQDLRRAGYWGGNADIDEISGTQALYTETASCADATWALMLNRRVFGKDDNRNSYGCLPTTASPVGDILVMRYAAPWVIGGVTSPGYDANHYYLRSSLFTGKLFKGADQADVINSISEPAVRTAELVARAYFIHPSTNSDATHCGGGDVPSLYRLGVAGGALSVEEIAYGVENMQIQYGIDTDNDDSVDSYVDANADPDNVMWDQIIAARIWLLIRAECPETAYTNSNTYTMAGTAFTYDDNIRRKLYTSTVRLRNR